MRALLIGSIALLVGFGFTGAALAADADGTWEWTSAGRGGGQPAKYVLKLKVEGEKLTGTCARDGQETAIEEGTVKGNEIAFSVTRARGDQKFTVKYTGKVEGDSIKGKTIMKRGDQENARDWEAKRAK